jgi:hypothetical protein
MSRTNTSPPRLLATPVRLALSLCLVASFLQELPASAGPVESGNGDEVREAQPAEDRSSSERPAAVEQVFSGPQPGEPLTGFPVRVVFGEEEGQEVDLVGRAPQSPWTLIFVHDVTRQSVAVTRAVMRYATSRTDDGLRTALIFLTADATDTENFLRRARHALPDDVIVGISSDGLEGPGDYGLNRSVTLTILVANEGMVTGNFALVQPSLQTDVLPVAETIVKTLGSGTVPPLERLVDGYRMEAADSAPDGDGVTLNQIRSLLQPIIRRHAREEDVRQIAAAVEEQLEANEALRNRIGQIARRIVQSDRLENYGTPAAQEVLRSWAEKYGREAPEEETPEQESPERESPKEESPEREASDKDEGEDEDGDGDTSDSVR